MRFKALAVIAAVATLSLMPIVGHCQITSVSPIRADSLFGQIAGIQSPSIQKLGDIAADNAQWFRFRVFDASGMGQYGQMIGSMFGGSGSSEYYTNGRQISTGDGNYLVAYSVQAKPLDWGALMRSGASTPPAPTPLTTDSPVTPSLLNLRTIPGVADVRPFDITAVINDSASQANSVATLMNTETNTAKSTTSLSNAKQVMLGVLMYAQDNNQHLPPMTSKAAFKKAVYPYIKSDQVFIDTSTGTPFNLNPWISKMSLSKIDSPATMVAIYSDPHAGGARVVGFTDGHAKLVGASGWTAAKSASHIP